MNNRVVIDTNVLISSIFWDKGNPHKIVKLAIEHKINNFTSLDILNELRRVLRVKFEQPEEIIQRQLVLITNYSKIIKPRVKVKAVKEDPSDNMILECALDSKAHYVITGDRHLLDIIEFKGIKIVSPREFLEIVTFK